MEYFSMFLVDLHSLSLFPIIILCIELSNIFILSHYMKLYKTHAVKRMMYIQMHEILFQPGKYMPLNANKTCIKQTNGSNVLRNRCSTVAFVLVTFQQIIATKNVGNITFSINVLGYSFSSFRITKVLMNYYYIIRS